VGTEKLYLEHTTHARVEGTQTRQIGEKKIFGIKFTMEYSVDLYFLGNLCLVWGILFSSLLA
jgi:hypothetical protein